VRINHWCPREGFDMWKKIKKAAKKVGNAIKKGAKAVVQGLKQVVNVVKTVINRVLGILDFIGSLIGIQPRKRIRVRFIVLADETGTPLLMASDLAASIASMDDVFRKECNTRLKPKDDSIIAIDTEPAPDFALTVRCDGKAYADDFGSRGWYFGWRARQNISGFLIGYAAPVTVFIVREHEGSKNGCSLGPLTDWVTVSAKVVNRDPLIVAHEVAHACGLWHWNKKDFLMRPDSPHGTRINRLQQSVFRNSRHVTYL
jgi:hypothetical protein